MRIFCGTKAEYVKGLLLVAKKRAEASLVFLERRKEKYGEKRIYEKAASK